MNCNEVRRSIVPYVDGELADDDRAALTGHIAECVDCTRRVAFEGNFNRMLREGLSEKEVPRSVLQRVRREVSEEARGRTSPWRRWLWHPLTGYAVAAALVVGLMLPASLGYGPRLSWTGTQDAEAISIAGMLVCIHCDRAQAGIPDQRSCRRTDHQTGVRTVDGDYWTLVNRGPGAELNRSPELRGSELRLRGQAYPEIATVDVRIFELI